jgi:hypothetical protein
VSSINWRRLSFDQTNLVMKRVEKEEIILKDVNQHSYQAKMLP